MESEPRLPTSTSFMPGLPRLLAVSVGLPVVIVLVDQMAIEASKSLIWLRVLMPILFIVQVGALAGCVGRFVDNMVLRCFVFAWTIVLVDAVALTTIYFGGGMNSQCMMFALVSSEFGLLTIWGIMSRMSWPIRLPLFLAATLFIVMIMMKSPGLAPWRHDSRLWAGILALQSVVFVVLCSIMRHRGYRLLTVNVQDCDPTTANREPFQFEIKHILLWTTVVTPILLLSKGMDWLLMEFQEVLWAITLALGMAIVSWVTMFAALGGNRFVVRVLILCAVPPMIGLLLTGVTSLWTVNWGTTRSAWLFIELREFGFGWILWTALAAWFLAALLLVFRAAGYQIQRV